MKTLDKAKINAIKFRLLRKISQSWMLCLNIDNQFYLKIQRRLEYIMSRIDCGCFGSLNKNKTFFVIIVKGEVGLFSIHNSVLEYVRYALNNDMIPIVDAWSFRNSLVNNNEIGRINGWEKFFVQPSSESLSEVYKSQNVVFSSSVNLNINYKAIYDNKRLKEDRIFCTKYLKLKEEILNEANERWNKLVNHDNNVIGVIGRGTDYLALHPSMHSVVPTEVELCSLVEKIISGKGYDKIFLATEDSKIRNSMLKAFGEKIVYTQDKVLNLKGEKKYLVNYIKENNIDCAGIQKEYLISILCLSKCNALITPVVAGALGACRLKDFDKNLHLLDLGLYKN